MNIGLLVLKWGTTACQCINKWAQSGRLESSLPREKWSSSARFQMRASQGAGCHISMTQTRKETSYKMYQGIKTFVPQFTFMAGSNLHHLSYKSRRRHIYKYFLNCRAHC